MLRPASCVLLVHTSAFLATPWLSAQQLMGNQHANAGGVVRIEATNSTWFVSIAPGDLTHILTPRARRLLREAGHTGRMFQTMKARTAGTQVLPTWWEGDWADGGPPRVPLNATASPDFVPYTIPALGLRRMLTEARLVGEPFSLKYSVLSSAQGDETWRTSRSASGVARTIELHDSAQPHAIYAAACERDNCNSGRSCMATIPTSTDSMSEAVMTGWRHDACAEDELVLLPPPGYLAMKFLLALPYPIIDGFTDEISCFGP